MKRISNQKIAQSTCSWCSKVLSEDRSVPSHLRNFCDENCHQEHENWQDRIDEEERREKSEYFERERAEGRDPKTNIPGFTVGDILEHKKARLRQRKQKLEEELRRINDQLGPQ